MANEQNPIDELFRNGMKDGGITPPPGVWEAVSASLPAAAAPGLATVLIKSIWTWVVLGGIAVGAIASVIYADKKEFSVDTNEYPQKQSVAKDFNTRSQVSKKSVNTESEEKTVFIEKQNQQSAPKPESADLGSYSSSNTISIVPSTKNPAGSLTSPKDKQPQKLLIEEQNPAVNAPCGRTVKINAIKSGIENTWTFAAAGISPGTYCSWMFGDGEASFGSPVQHSYADLNSDYEVKVLVFRSAGCIDSGTQRVVTRQRHTGLIIPDVFTPNGDNINDELVITLPEVDMFNQVVTDRNGRQVFVSNNAAIRWNGKCASIECPAGTYRVTITYKTPSAKQAVTYTKNVLLNR